MSRSMVLVFLLLILIITSQFEWNQQVASETEDNSTTSNNKHQQSSNREEVIKEKCFPWRSSGVSLVVSGAPPALLAEPLQLKLAFHLIKAAMRGFTQKIVKMMKSEGLFETQGGPIILSQIENEYGPLEPEMGSHGVAYTDWAAKMAVGLGTGVPWVMCKQDDAPDPVYHGGTNFDRTAGGPFIATSYDYVAPIDEYDYIISRKEYSKTK